MKKPLKKAKKTRERKVKIGDIFMTESEVNQKLGEINKRLKNILDLVKRLKK